LFVGAEKRLGSLRALPKEPSPPEKKKPKKKPRRHLAMCKTLSGTTLRRKYFLHLVSRGQGSF
jgi:hypothetical protein